jgi:hypothetical protein
MHVFVQIIEGRAGDREGLRRQGERWMAELRPGAKGFLGATEGITDDGHSITVVRFESATAAQANSDRPEQGQWWAETEKYYDGDVTFQQSEDVDTMLGGGSNDAGFVQIMKGTAAPADVHAMDALFEKHAPTFRPDVIGGFRAWIGPDAYTEVIYFTSEADARANEGNPPPAELQAQMGRYEEMMANVEFLDLKEPRIF